MDKYALDYCPHIHVDSVIGWAWLMFESYDFIQNPLEFSEDAIVELKYVYNHVKDISLADSFGVDFHKTGYSPYLCSMFICKDKQKYLTWENPNKQLWMIWYMVYMRLSHLRWNHLERV